MNRKLIIEEWLSLDGHVADKTGQLDFFVKHVRESSNTALRIDFLNSIDTILLGRKTYEQFSALWPERPVENDLLSEKMNTVNKLVFSDSLQDAPWGKWPKAGLVKGDLASEIKALKALPGKNIVLWGSITLAQALMKENLVDEYRLHLCPTLTGGGRKLFANDTHPSNLSLIETNSYNNNVVFARYSVGE